MGCMLNFRKRNPRKQNETENFSIIRMDGGMLSRNILQFITQRKGEVRKKNEY
jgi:hypothetical protein